MTHSIGESIIERMEDMKYMDSLFITRTLLFPESRSVIRDKMIDRSFSFYMSFYDSPDIGTGIFLIPYSDLPKVICKQYDSCLSITDFLLIEYDSISTKHSSKGYVRRIIFLSTSSKPTSYTQRLVVTYMSPSRGTCMLRISSVVLSSIWATQVHVFISWNLLESGSNIHTRSLSSTYIYLRFVAVIIFGGFLPFPIVYSPGILLRVSPLWVYHFTVMILHIFPPSLTI